MKRIFLDTNILIDYIDNRAGAAGCDYIITNDHRHYDFSDIPFFSSSAFVEQLDELI